MCESPLSKCFWAKLCILVSIICNFGSPKTDATIGDSFKGRVQNICIKQRGWEQCKVASHKVVLRTRPVKGGKCVQLPLGISSVTFRRFRV